MMRLLFNRKILPLLLVALGAVETGCASHSAALAPSDLASDTAMNGTGGRKVPSREGGGMPEGLAKAHGHYYYVHNGQGTLLTQRQSFAQGAVFDGRTQRIMLGDGSIVRLSDGDMVTFSGDRIPLPPATELP